MLIFLSVEEVVRIHEEVINSFGGTEGIRDMGLIQSAVSRPQSTFGGEYLYTTVFLMSAALVESFILNHSFFDGNKRTAIASTDFFLHKNKFRLTLPFDESIKLILDINNHYISFEEISNWLKKHSTALVE